MKILTALLLTLLVALSVAQSVVPDNSAAVSAEPQDCTDSINDYEECLQDCDSETCGMLCGSYSDCKPTCDLDIACCSPCAEAAARYMNACCGGDYTVCDVNTARLQGCVASQYMDCPSGCVASCSATTEDCCPSCVGNLEIYKEYCCNAQKVSNLQVTLVGVPLLERESFGTLSDVAATHTVAYYIANPQHGISNVVTSFEFVDQASTSKRRRLQGEQVTLTYDQTISYDKSPSSTLTTLEVVTLPFESQASRDEYTEKLRETGVAAFENILSTSPVDTSNATISAVPRQSTSSSAERPVPLSFATCATVGVTGLVYF